MTDQIRTDFLRCAEENPPEMNLGRLYAVATGQLTWRNDVHEREVYIIIILLKGIIYFIA